MAEKRKKINWRAYNQELVNRGSIFAILLSAAACGASAGAPAGASAGALWRGLVVEEESRCAEFNRKKEYPHRQKVELEIIERMGGRIYGPYEGRVFKSRKETDIEHIVAVSEAHDSGMCAMPLDVKKRFAEDLDNLTLASPGVNRHMKSARDAGSWTPMRNKCWFANSVVNVKLKYGLSADRREAEALEDILSQCASVEMQFPEDGVTSYLEDEDDPANEFDLDGNGRITCQEARTAGIAPVERSHPAYARMLDRDEDGIVCE